MLTHEHAWGGAHARCCCADSRMLACAHGKAVPLHARPSMRIPDSQPASTDPPSVCEWELSARFPIQPNSAQAACQRRFKGLARIAPAPAVQVGTARREHQAHLAAQLLPLGTNPRASCPPGTAFPHQRALSHHDACTATGIPEPGGLPRRAAPLRARGYGVRRPPRKCTPAARQQSAARDQGGIRILRQITRILPSQPATRTGRSPRTTG